MNDTTTLRSSSTLKLSAGGLGVLGGIWLIISPYLFGYNNLAGADQADGNTATTLGLIAGIIAILLTAFIVATERVPSLKTYQLLATGLTVLLGAIVMAIPYLFDFQALGNPLWNLQLTGAAFVLIAGYILEGLSKQTKQEQLTTIK